MIPTKQLRFVCNMHWYFVDILPLPPLILRGALSRFNNNNNHNNKKKNKSRMCDNRSVGSGEKQALYLL